MILDSPLNPGAMSDLDSIARQAFEAMAQLIPATEPGSELESQLPFGMNVEYSGGVSGRLLVLCNSAFAFDFTERFMRVSFPEHFDEDVTDALGELANTIGGNFKGLLPMDTCLSIPSISSAIGAENTLRDETEVGRLSYSFENGECQVVVFRRDVAA